MRKTLAVVLFMLPLVATALAQGPTCTVNSDTVTPDCSGSMWLSGVTCVHKTIKCPTTPDGVSFSDAGLTYGYKTPTSPLGTIVFFSPKGGHATDEPTDGTGSSVYAGDYYTAGYQVVQTEWDAGLDWEDTGTSTKNIGGWPILADTILTEDAPALHPFQRWAPRASPPYSLVTHYSREFRATPRRSNSHRHS